MGGLRKSAAGAALAVIGVLALGSLAGAQTSGYPGPVTAANTTNTQTVVIAVGSSLAVSACGFDPGTSVAPFGLTADSTGCVSILISVGSGPAISVEGGAGSAAIYGLNPNVTTLTGANTQGGTQTDFVNVDIPTSATGPASSSNNLAFTGADIMAMVIGGLGLVAIGFLVLTFVRRRSNAPS